MSSQNKDIIYTIYSNCNSVFTLKDIAMLTNETDIISLSKRLDYYVKRGKINRPRKGIYTKFNYSHEELGCKLYTPSYLSLEYILQKAGIIFQYSEKLTYVSYLSRSVSVDNKIFSYRKIKGEIIVSTNGIIQNNNINIATPERAFLDILYLNGETYFDSINPLNKELVYKLLPIYNSKSLTKTVKKIFSNGEFE